MVHVDIRCPECLKTAKVDVEENILHQSKRGISAINICALICDHTFVAYIDTNLNVRDCFITDFTIDLPQIELEQISEEKIPDQDIVNVYLLTLNLLPSFLSNILRACFFKKKILIINELRLLNPHILNFFKFIFQDTFDIDISLKQGIKYKKEKKKYKDYIVIDKDNVIRDKEKILGPKSNKIEKSIVQKFFAEKICPRVSLKKTDILERRGMKMCKDCCEHPEKLKGKPEECSAELIRECHGDVKEHPCKEEKKES